ncbi:hypothetical protein [Beggiatoa leptomitoformis]|uniref:Uncharacterized protein n=1 Tax=Beggiatoa leptomitoformis TaxID=288004 RepID=A0A2N9YHG4_9GAMM|nr:hypothetical protein [Beggiatoa leptomitoformis]ALG67896.1 hypothetical protein AL038_09460 [Beggiatoa leptomitoformis]AUI69839.1 hypothetical protein BLE401_14820 [Beggiatoa leptomitoformis]
MKKGIQFNTTGFTPADWLRAEVLSRFVKSYPKSAPKSWFKTVFEGKDINAVFENSEKYVNSECGLLDVRDEFRKSGESTGKYRENAWVRDYEDEEVAVLCLEQ